MTSRLESLLRPVAASINRQIDAKTPARELCSQLDNQVMALRVKDTALAVYLVVADDQIVLTGTYDRDPDVIVSGSLIALGKLLGPASDDAIRKGDINFSGDILIAQQFQKLLKFGRPDLEEELSRVVGDTVAHGISNLLHGIGEWGRDAGGYMRQNVAEYLQEETRAVATRDEITEFGNDVEKLRDDVARFEAHLRKLESTIETEKSV